MSDRPDLHIVPKTERQPNLLMPDYKRIHTMLIGRNGGSALWGSAGPFILSERDFHRLCTEARRLEKEAS